MPSSDALPPQLSQLTERERQIFDAVISGHRSKEIARMLGVSPRTVDAHRSNILRKTGARAAIDLVRLALQAERR